MTMTETPLIRRGAAFDLTNRRFGALVALHVEGKTKHGANVWTCRCDCGQETPVACQQLTRGVTKSCGCRRLDGRRAYAVERRAAIAADPTAALRMRSWGPRTGDLTGRRFGRLEVVRIAASVSGSTRWLCRCDCGGEKVVARPSLIVGSTKSCGCLKRENNAAIAGRRKRAA